MDPGEAYVRTFQMIQLRLLADPENAEGEKAHEIDEDIGSKAEQRVKEVAIAMDDFGGGQAEVDGEKGHGDGENAVTQSGEALHAVTGETVVRGIRGMSKVAEARRVVIQREVMR
jgi:hypothetical protein